MTDRADVVRVARSYIDTPFGAGQGVSGVAMDCAHVLICLARELQLVDSDFRVPIYTQVPDGETMIAWCDRYMGARRTQEEMQPGDAVVLKMERFPQHLGILGDWRSDVLSIIHAASNARPPRVLETRLMFTRSLRFVTAYSFPGIA